MPLKKYGDMGLGVLDKISKRKGTPQKAKRSSTILTEESKLNQRSVSLLNLGNLQLDLIFDPEF